MSDLTILLPLKGRHLHTVRFLWHAERERLPYRFLIADGEVHPVIAKLLENPAIAFPHLDIEYVRCPDDVNYGVFFQKLALASARVKTRYVMQADNDDVLVRSGIDHCMAFLDGNADYASCGGGVGGFSLHRSSTPALSQVAGTIQALGSQYHDQYVSHDYSSSSAADRIRQRFSSSYTLYYNVFRSPALAKICRECAELNFNDLQIHESYFGMRAKSLGKSRFDRTVMSYMRQGGTSQAAAAIRDNLAERLAREQFHIDIDTLIDAIARAVADIDNVDANAFAGEIRQLYAQKLEGELSSQHAGIRQPAVADQLRNYLRAALVAILPESVIARRRQTRRGVAREAIFSDLRVAGAPDIYILEFREELSRIEAMLEGADFIDFCRRRVPQLMAPRDPTEGSRRKAA